MKKNKYKSGFSLVELLVAVAILGILASIMIPSFTGFIKNMRLTTVSNDFITAVSLARTSAIKNSKRSQVIAIDDSDANNEWGSGWFVWVDLDEDSVMDNGADDLEVILQYNSVAQDVILDQVAGTASITFNRLGVGYIAQGAKAIEICDSRADEVGRKLDLTALGVLTKTSKYDGCN